MSKEDSHIDALDSVLPILTNNMRELKALQALLTVNEHGLSLIEAGVLCFHFPDTKVDKGDKE